MTARLAHIIRHPVKAIGHEMQDRASLTTGKPLPWDRHWALAHEAAKPDMGAWQPKMNFLRGVAGPELMAIACRWDETSGEMVLTHPRAGTLAFRPEDQADKLIDWIAPLWPAGRPAPARLIAAEGVAFGDCPDPFLSILNLASNQTLGEAMGRDLAIHRWRGNLWLGGFDAFTEFDLVGQRLRIGTAVLEVRERITRCKATCVDPETGAEDGDTLAALRSGWGHEDFGVYAVVIEPGKIVVGDHVEVL